VSHTYEGQPYPSIETYEALYARYVKGRPVSELIRLAGGVKNSVVWDICAGGGDLSLKCLKEGASRVVAIDASAAMMSRLWEWQREKKRRYTHLDIEVSDLVTAFSFGRLRLAGHPWEALRKGCGYDNYPIAPFPDVVFCRQGVNYWFNKEAILLLANRMKPGSVLCFNTFNQRPPLSPVTRKYEFEGHHFAEVSWRVSSTKMVYHVQIRDGMQPHYTAFPWITPRTFYQILNPYFVIGEDHSGNTSLYRCVRRKRNK